MNNDPAIYLSDVKKLLRKHQKRFVKISVACFIASFIVLLFKNPLYQAQATFKQSSGSFKDQFGIHSLLSDVGIRKEDTSAISCMYSKKLLYPIIKKFGLQIEVERHSFFSKVLCRMAANFSAEFHGRVRKNDLFRFRDVKMLQMHPLQFYLKISGENFFDVFDDKKQWLTRGHMQQLIKLPLAEFVLENIPPDLPKGKFFVMKITPWPSIADALKKHLVIKPDKTDRNMINLSLTHASADLSAEILNALMAQFESYLKEEHHALSKEQLAYLDQRRADLGDKFNQTLQEQVAYLKKNLGENGFIGLQQEIELLAAPKEEYISTLLDLDLEMRRWQSLEKTQDLALNANDSSSKNTLPLLFSHEFSIKPQALDLKKQQLLKKLVNLDFKQAQLLASPLKSLPVFDPQYVGIDLPMAQKLYAEYSHEKEMIQAQITELQFLHKQMRLDNFELSSLSNTLLGPVSQEIAKKSADLRLVLCDEINRSSREQERIKLELDTQKKFLQQHIAQTIELCRLKLGMIQEKMSALQKTAIQLIKNEKELINDKLSELKLRMSDLPEKWRLENALKFKKDLMMRIIETMTLLCESKIINNHLFQVESRPLDCALVPSSIGPPHLILYSTSLALCGGFLFFLVNLFKLAIYGASISSESLKEHKKHFSGYLSSNAALALKELTQDDLETLRKLAHFSADKSLLILGGQGVNFSHNLATLLSLEGCKTILIHINFNDNFSHEQEGFYKYLIGESEEYSVRRENAFDYLPTGGISRFGAELLNRPRFAALIHELKNKYDRLILYCDDKISSSQNDRLMEYADVLAVALNEEKWSDLEHLDQWQKKENALETTYLIFQN